jgi:hypothetical protein
MYLFISTILLAWGFLLYPLFSSLLLQFFFVHLKPSSPLSFKRCGIHKKTRGLYRYSTCLFSFNAKKGDMGSIQKVPLLYSDGRSSNERRPCISSKYLDNKLTDGKLSLKNSSSSSFSSSSSSSSSPSPSFSSSSSFSSIGSVSSLTVSVNYRKLLY